ncbi:hypothetical protein OG216_35100 [Streptomycetaceae bacterium NBC_01309]
MLDNVVSSPGLSVAEVKGCLRRLRQGHALARPTAVLTALTDPVRDHLANVHAGGLDPVEEVTHLVSTIRLAIQGLADAERVLIQVDLNLAPEHRYPTLTERQESLARSQKCAAKTIRRRSDRALDTLAYMLLADREAYTATSTAPANASAAVRERATAQAPWWDDLRAFWRLSDGAGVDIICSEIPEPERPEYAAPSDRNYLRYAKFADLDTLIYLRSRFAQLALTATIRDFAPSEYYDTHADVLVVVGGPPWNAKYREFLQQLPFYFDPHPLGEDDPLVVPALDGLTLGPHWTERHELLEDLAVFTRLTLAGGTTVFLLGGCLTLGVLGAARCLLEAERGARSARRITELVGDADFVLVIEARRVGGITDVADLTTVPPLLLLARHNNDPFVTVVDNCDRYPNKRTAKGS